MVTGAATKGPIRGATISFFDLDDFGFAIGAALATVTSDTFGNFSVTLPAGTGPVLVQTRGGSFIDESDEEPDPALRRQLTLTSTQGFESVLPAGGSVVAITPVTQALVNKARDDAAANGSFLTRLQSGKDIFQSALGFDVMSTLPSDPNDPAATDTDAAKQYAMLLGGIANATNNIAIQLLEPRPTFEIIQAVTADLEDATLDGMAFGAPISVVANGTTQEIPSNIDFDREINRFRNNNIAGFETVVAPVIPPEAVAALENQLPVAVAGADVSVNAGVAVTLDGSASIDPEDDVVSYVWTQISGPAVTISDATVSELTFTAPVLTVPSQILQFQLAVFDSTGQTDVDTVSVTVNQAPDAVAGNDQSVSAGTSVVLDGTASSDPEGNPLSYSWTQTSGATVSTSDTSLASLSFTAPAFPVVSEALQFQLQVADGAGLSSVDSVIVTVVNQAPSAIAGPDQSVDQGTAVVLDGAGSSDPEGGALSYAWSQTSGVPVTFTSSTSATLSFTVPALAETSETLSFQLVVTDNAGLQAVDTVTVTALNRAPVANAGLDQSVDQGTAVVLDGAGSSDPEGDTLTYAWTQTRGPGVALTNSTLPTLSFTAPVSVATPQSLEFQITVTDVSGQSATDAVTVSVVPAISANVFVVKETAVPLTFGNDVGDGIQLTLNADGTGTSIDRETAFQTFNWTQASGALTLDFTNGAGAGNGPVKFDSTFTNVNGDQFTEVITQDEIVLTLVTDTPVRDAFDVATSGVKTLTNVTQGTAAVSSPDVELITAGVYDATATQPFLINAGETRTLLTNVSTAVGTVVNAPDILVDKLTFQADGTGFASEKNATFNWQIAADGHLQVTFSDGELADYYRLSARDTGDVVAAIYTYADGSRQFEPELSVVDDPALSWATLAAAGTLAGIYESRTAVELDDGSRVERPITIRLSPDGTGLLELPIIDTATGESTPSRSNLGICWQVDPVTGELQTDRANNPGFYNAQPDPGYCASARTQDQIALQRQRTLLDQNAGLNRGFVRELRNTCGAAPSEPTCQLVVDTYTAEALAQVAVFSNTPPVAIDAAVTTTAGNPVDFFAASLAVDAEAGVDPATVAIVKGPGTGTVTVVDGIITFTPDAGSVTETFFYTLEDVDGNLSNFGRVDVLIDPPNAFATASPSVAPFGSVVTLNASDSSDTDGIASYQWRQTAGTAQVVLSNPTGVSTTFTAPSSFDGLQFELEVVDPDGLKGFDFVNVSVPSGAPTASVTASDVAPNRAVTSVSLDGSASSDDGGAANLTFNWSQVGATDVTLVVDPQTPDLASFDPAGLTGLRTFQLEVIDADGFSAVATLDSKIVNDAPGAVLTASNTTPARGEFVDLFTTASSDDSGSIATYNVVQLAGTAVSLSPDSLDPRNVFFGAPTTLETLTFELAVVDTEGSSATTTIDITTVNTAPTANIATLPATVLQGGALSLDGFGSSDDDQIVAYQWSQLTGTPGTFSNQASATPIFTASNTIEQVTLQLQVTDSDGATAVTTATVEVVGEAPVAGFTGVPSAGGRNQALTLDGSTNSSDNLGIASYVWTTDGSGTFDDLNSSTPIYTTGANLTTETITLTVIDDDGFSDAVSAAILIENTLPVADAGTQINSGQDINNDGAVTVALDGSGSFDDIGGFTYSWAQDPSDVTQVSLTGANTVSPTFVAPLLGFFETETLTFTLTIEDSDAATAQSTVNVLVEPILSNTGFLIEQLSLPTDFGNDIGESLYVEFTSTPGAVSGPVIVTAENDEAAFGFTWTQTINPLLLSIDLSGSFNGGLEVNRSPEVDSAGTQFNRIEQIVNMTISVVADGVSQDEVATIQDRQVVDLISNPPTTDFLGETVNYTYFDPTAGLTPLVINDGDERTLPTTISDGDGGEFPLAVVTGFGGINNLGTDIVRFDSTLTPLADKSTEYTLDTFTLEPTVNGELFLNINPGFADPVLYHQFSTGDTGDLVATYYGENIEGIEYRATAERSVLRDPAKPVFGDPVAVSNSVVLAADLVASAGIYISRGSQVLDNGNVLATETHYRVNQDGTGVVERLDYDPVTGEASYRNSDSSGNDYGICSSVTDSGDNEVMTWSRQQSSAIARIGESATFQTSVTDCDALVSSSISEIMELRLMRVAATGEMLAVGRFAKNPCGVDPVAVSNFSEGTAPCFDQTFNLDTQPVVLEKLEWQGIAPVVPPRAVSQEDLAHGGSPITVFPLSNDIAGTQGSPATTVALDPSTLTILAGPSNGTISTPDPSDGSFIYTPDGTGQPDTIYYFVRDINGNRSTFARITLRVSTPA